MLGSGGSAPVGACMVRSIAMGPPGCVGALVRPQRLATQLVPGVFECSEDRSDPRALSLYPFGLSTQTWGMPGTATRIGALIGIGQAGRDEEARLEPSFWRDR